MTWRSILAFVAIVPAAATFYFFIFWRWFDFWRKHRVLTFLMLIGSVVAVPVLVGGPSGWALAERIRFPAAVQIVGWFLFRARNDLRNHRRQADRPSCAIVHAVL